MCKRVIHEMAKNMSASRFLVIVFRETCTNKEKKYRVGHCFGRCNRLFTLNLNALINLKSAGQVLEKIKFSKFYT